MVDYLSLIPLMNLGIKKLMLFGDKYQIGNVEFSQSSGTRPLSNLLMLCKNVEVSNEIRRIG